MMQRLADDPAFWAAVTAILGLLAVWAKAKAAEFEAAIAKGKADSVAQGQGVQQVTLLKHGEQIAALEAVAGSGERGAGAVSTGAPATAAAPAAVPAANSVGPLPPGVMTPTTVPLPLSSAPAVEHTTSGIVLPDQAAPAP